MKRIIIFGPPGSGKSTFAKALSQRLDIPLFHLDCFYFAANWTTREPAEFLAVQREIVNQDRWIVDGNCLNSLEVRFARADTALYFNRPTWLCLWRVYRRSVKARPGSSDRPVDCQEGVPWKLIKYIWKFRGQVNAHLPYLQNTYPQVDFWDIRRTADVVAFMTRVSKLTSRGVAVPLRDASVLSQSSPNRISS